MEVSKYIVNFFKKKGIKYFFVFQGSNISHLINEVGKEKKCNYVVPHHEQSLSMQVDTMARLNGYGVGMVTSGPGATNILTGVCSAYYDSIPCFFITGQVGQVHIKSNKNYRQFGFQETDVVSIYKRVTKYSKQIQNSSEIPFELEKAYQISLSGRPGPVLLDIPWNIQRQKINKNEKKKFILSKNDYSNEIKKIRNINQYLKLSKKPILLIGGGIKRNNIAEKLLKIIKTNKLPFVTTWTSHDIVDYYNDLYIGSIGRNGNRSANKVCAEADLIITMGQRFAVKNIFGKFGTNAKIISIDIDKEELKSPLAKINLGINLPLDIFVKNWKPFNFKNIKEWLKETTQIKKDLFDINIICKEKKNRNLVNPFNFFREISPLVNKNSQIHLDIGAHQTWFYQSFLQRKSQTIINHCGHGAMGHAICSSIAGHYSNKNKFNLVIIGDGGFMMNVQELNYIKMKNLPIKIIVINNSSLGNTFADSLMKYKISHANEIKTGYMAPNIRNISKGFDIKYYKINKDNLTKKIFTEFKSNKSSAILDVVVSKFHRTAELNLINSDKKIIYL